MLINHNINNLCGGVSRQPDELRFDAQVEEMINFVPTAYGKVIKRKPCVRIASISNITSEPIESMTYEPIVKTHTYDRGDGSEKYGMFVQQTKQPNGTFTYSLRVFTENGTELTVNNLYGRRYIGSGQFQSTSNPVFTMWNSILSGAMLTKDDIEFLTVGDTTWLLNKKIPVNHAYTSSPSYNENKAFYWVQKSFDDGQGKGYDYLVEIDGKQVKVKNTVTTQDVDANGNAINVETTVFNLPNGTTSVVVAKQIATVINGGDQGAGGSDWTGYSARAEGSIVRIWKTDYSAFTYQFGDSWGNQASKGWTNKVAKISDLPSKMDGFTTAEVGIVTVEGTNKDDHNNYYVKWDGEVWVETIKSGLYNVIDKQTMFAKIVRQPNGSFSIGFLDPFVITDFPTTVGFSQSFAVRLKGDDDSCPMPSFIGNRINGMFFYKNRLGLISEENVILSEAGDYYNFFGTTAMEVIDSDPIDVSIDSNEVSNIKFVTPMAGALTLWTDNGQYLLQGGEILSPATVSISKTSSYDCDLRHRPLTIDNEIIFFNSTSGSFDAYVYSPASLNSDTSTAEALTSHIPNYLPNDFDMCVASSEHNIVIMKPKYTDSTNRGLLYCYKYHISNGQRVMSAWFKWKVAVDIDTINIIGSKLFIIHRNSIVPSTTRAIMVMDLSDIEMSQSVNLLDTTESGISVAYDGTVLTLSKFSLETSQKSKIFIEDILLKKIELSSSSINSTPYITNTERNQVISTYNANAPREAHLGLKASSANIGIQAVDTAKECSIGSINIVASINSRSKNI